MPELSRFFGIVIAMFYDDHVPPHFHAKYGDDRAIVAIDTLALLRGELPPRALGLVMEWAAQHRLELQRTWAAAQRHEKLDPIPPLE